MPKIRQVGLIRRGQKYYYRVRIPKDLKHVFRRNEIMKSLRTESVASAKVQAKGLSYRVERLFMQVRCGMLTKEQIKYLIKENLDGLLNDFEEARDFMEPANGPYNPAGGEDSAEWAEFLAEYHQKELVPGAVNDGLDFAFRFLQEKGFFKNQSLLDLDDDDLKLVRFASREFHKSFISVFKTEKERLAGNYDNPYDSFTQSVAARAAKLSPSLGKALELFVEEKKAKGRAEKTVNEFDRQRRLYLKVLGDKPVDQFVREDFVKVKGILEQWPKNANTLSRQYGHKIEKYNLDGLGIGEIIKRANQDDLGEPYSTRTVHKHLEAINSTFKFCVTSGWIDKSPCPSWKEPDKDEEEQMRPFSQEEISRLFSSSLFGPKSKRLRQPEVLWAFIIAAFSGMRIGEVVQLAVGDIFQDLESELWSFDINAKGEKSLKNKSSRRIVPIHPQLIELGFLEYVESARGMGEVWLWPNLKKAKGFDKDNFSKLVNRDIKKHCVKDKRVRFHSFRDTFAHALAAAGVGESIIGSILGHASESKVTEKYMGKYPPPVMLEAMEKIQYDFDFSSLESVMPKKS
jgi:integrase